MITDLPPEIVVEIVPSLDYGDIFALMLCAKSLYIKLFPSLYEEIVLTTLGPYDRPLLARSPRRLTERNRRKFFSALDIGLISDDALGSIKRVTMTDLVSETYISAGNAPERLEIIKQALPMMTKLRHFDLILGQATIFMPRTFHEHCVKYYLPFLCELEGVEISLDLAGKGFPLATVFVPANTQSIVHLNSSLPLYWDSGSIELGRRQLLQMLSPLRNLRHLDLEGGLEEPADFFDLSLGDHLLPHLESLILRRIFQPKNLLPSINLGRFKRLELHLCDVFDRSFQTIAQMENLTTLIIDQSSFLPVRLGPPTPRQPDLSPLASVKFTALRKFHIFHDISEHKRANYDHEPDVLPIAIVPPQFVSAVIHSNPNLRSIIVPSLSDSDLALLAQPHRAQRLEVLELLVPSMIGIQGAYTSQGLTELFSVPCKRLKRVRFSTLNAKISLEMLTKLLTGSQDLRQLSWDCLDSDRSGEPFEETEWDILYSSNTPRSAKEREDELQKYFVNYKNWAAKVLAECFVEQDRALLVACLAKLRFTLVVDEVYSLYTSEYLNQYKIIDSVGSSGGAPRRDGLLGFRDLLGLY